MQHRRRESFDELEDGRLLTDRYLNEIYRHVVESQCHFQATRIDNFFSRARPWGFAKERDILFNFMEIRIPQEHNLLGVDLLSLMTATISKLQNQLEALPYLYPVSSLNDNSRTIHVNRYLVEIKEQDHMRLTEPDHGGEFTSRSHKSSSKCARLGSAECLAPTTVFGIAMIALRMISYYFVSGRYGGLRMKLHDQ